MCVAGVREAPDATRKKKQTKHFCARIYTNDKTGIIAKNNRFPNVTLSLSNTFLLE